MPNITLTQPVDQTSPSDAGHTTTEHFWTKILVICGIVLAVAGFAGDLIAQVSGLLPEGSKALKYAGVVGAIITGVAQVAYLASRTLVKMKLVDAEIAAKALPPEKRKNPDAAAASVLGEDAPEK